MRYNAALQLTRGACRFRSRRARRVRLRWPGVPMPTDGYFGGQSRLAESILYNEGEPLAPELDRSIHRSVRYKRMRD